MSIIDDYDLFIFDWDGTLSTSTILVKVSRLVKRRYNPDYIRRHKSKYIASNTNLMRREFLNKIYANLYDVYSKLAMPHLKKDVVSLLELLQRRRKKIAIFSDSEEYRLLNEVKKLGILGKVDFVLSANAIGSYKPDPIGLITIQKQYKTPKSRTIYIGDMASDIITAKFAGIASCGVADGFDPYGLLKEAGADHTFRSLSELFSELAKSRKRKT